MALLFDETNDYLTIADADALSLPDGDWSLGGWVRLTDNTGSGYQYLVSWGSLSATNSINWYLYEHTLGDVCRASMVDSDGGTSLSIVSTGTPGTSTAWQHFLLVRGGSTVTQYLGGTADGSASVGSFDAVDRSTAFYLGSRSDLSGTRFLGGSLAEWAKWDRALSAEEIAGLVAGLAPAFLPRGLAWYLPLVGGAVERVAGLTVTNNGAVVSEHPPRISYPPAGRRCGAAASLPPAPRQFRVAAGQVCRGGGAAGQVVRSGAAAGQVVAGGAVAAQVI